MFNQLGKALLCGLLFISSHTQAALIEVDLELQLLADVSGSVDSTEYNLQKQGYVNAFNSAAIVNAIQAGALGKIAVQYIEWSGDAQQSVKVDWMLIEDAASAAAFASALSSATRAFNGLTAPGNAISFGANLFFNNNYDAVRQVMDVSGDGAQNTGTSTSGARDAALALGVDTINGITIGNESGLQTWYVNNVIGGTNAFQSHATTFAAFESAISNKLIREITNQQVPEPTSLAIFMLALLGLVSSANRRT